MAQVFATLDPANKRSTIVLSGGDLTATSNDSPGNWSCVAATQNKTTGKWYWEMLVNTGTNGGYGICPPSSNLATGNQTIEQLSPAGIGNAATVTMAAGHTFGLALDADAKTMKLYDNNVLGGTIDISALGSDFLPVFLIQTSAFNITCNFGASALTYTPPSGYNAGLYTGTPDSGPANLKTYNTNAKANMKTMNTNAIANVKTFDTNP